VTSTAFDHFCGSTQIDRHTSALIGRAAQIVYSYRTGENLSLASVRGLRFSGYVDKQLTIGQLHYKASYTT
jgi:hypothetical protein